MWDFSVCKVLYIFCVVAHLSLTRTLLSSSYSRRNRGTVCKTKQNKTRLSFTQPWGFQLFFPAPRPTSLHYTEFPLIIEDKDWFPFCAPWRLPDISPLKFELFLQYIPTTCCGANKEIKSQRDTVTRLRSLQKIKKIPIYKNKCCLHANMAEGKKSYCLRIVL